jgi:formylglycine-generating enzyme required for sulfatase activity
MGSSAADADGGGDEQPLHLVDVPYGYWLARYPLTVAPFRHFLAASGHSLAYDWQALEVPANRPLQAVSWADALVFCDWLHARWQALGWLPAGFRLTLPSEAEWEKGARGGVRLPRQPRFQWAEHGRLRPPRATGTLPNPHPQRIYPWGDEIDADRANYDEMPLTGTTAVGAFPRGASPYGLLDVAGNVLEWTRSLYSRRAADGQEQYFAYPYNSEDGRETLEAAGNAKRVVRGGFYLGDATWLRCAHRYGWTSEQPLFTGVRLAVVPIHRPRVAPATT